MNSTVKFLKIISAVVIIWLSVVICLNFRSIKVLLNYFSELHRYEYLSKDKIPPTSEYGIIYPFTSLLEDTTTIPVFQINRQIYDYNDFPAESKVNYRRMMFITNFLDRNGITYNLQLVPGDLANFQVYTSNIFINPSEANDFSLVTAHYDVINKAKYQGAMDNSAAVIVLLNLLKKNINEMKAKKIAVLFTTLEEQGLLGAEAFLNMTTFNIKKVICLDGIGRGLLGVMNSSQDGFGFRFKNLLFQNKIFTGTKFKDCPRYYSIDTTVIDFDRYKIKKLNSFLSSTDARIFLSKSIPTVNLVSSDIVHFVKVLHTENDRVEGLDYSSLLNCESVLTQWIKSQP